MGEEEETKSRARGDSFETLRLSRCAALLCLHKEARKRKRKKEGTRTTLTPLSRPHTHTLDIYYLAPSSCEQLLAVAFVQPQLQLHHLHVQGSPWQLGSFTGSCARTCLLLWRCTS